MTHQKDKYRLDKSIFEIKSFEKANLDNASNLHLSFTERLNVGMYLSYIAYGIDPYNPPKTDRSKLTIRMRKHENSD
jgi:hypothetical protein